MQSYEDVVTLVECNHHINHIIYVGYPGWDFLKEGYTVYPGG